MSHPLGQLAYRGSADLIFRMDLVCKLCPEARVLIVAESPLRAAELHEGLFPTLGNGVGPASDQDGPRCQIAPRDLLKRMDLGWRHMLLVPISSSRDMTWEHYRTITGGVGGLRVYTFVPHTLRPDKATLLRLEALSGALLSSEESDEHSHQERCIVSAADRATGDLTWVERAPIQDGVYRPDSRRTLSEF
jgi:hypothetical protein